MSSLERKEEGKMAAIPDLQNMLNECKRPKVVDSNLLKNAVDTVKAHLKSDSGKVDDLLEYDGVVGILVECLKQGGNNCSMQFSVVWIVDIVLTKGSDQLVRAVIDPNVGAIPWIVKLLQSPDPAIYEKASKVLAELTTLDDAHPQLCSNATAIFTPVGKLLQSKKPSPDFYLSAVKIVIEMVFKASGENSESFDKILTGGPIYLEVRRFSTKPKPAMEAYRLTLRVLNEALGLIPQLLELNCIRRNDNVRREIFKCLMSASAVHVPNVKIGVFNNIKNPVVEAGCSRKIVEFLSDPDDALAFGVAYIMWQIAFSGDEVFFDFLPALDGQGGLSNLSRVFTLDEKMFPELRTVTNGVMALVHIVVERNLFKEFKEVQLLLNSGLVDAIIFCVKQPSVLGKTDALRNLGNLIEKLPVSERAVCGVILPEVVSVLKAKAPSVKEEETRFACAKILVGLVEGNAVRRDYALTLGAPSALANLLGSHDQLSGEQRVLILRCIKRLIEVKPHAAIGTFTEIPKAFHIYFLECKSIIAQEIMTALKIVALLLEYEKDEGVEATLPFYMHMDFSDSFRASHLLSVWLDVTSKLVTHGSPANRLQLLVNGLVKQLEKALQVGKNQNKLLALQTLRVFIQNTEFSAVELEVVKSIQPAVVKAKSGNLLCQREANLVLENMRNLKANGLVDECETLADWNARAARTKVEVRKVNR